MGSFNSTCFASHQGIHSGDRCRIFLVRQQTSYRPVRVRRRDGSEEFRPGPYFQTTSPTGLWCPIASSLEAVYDDRQAYTLVDSPSNRRALSTWLAYVASFGDTTLLEPATAQTREEVGFDPSEVLKRLAPELSRRTEEARNSAVVPFEILSDADFEEASAVMAEMTHVMSEGRLFGRSVICQESQPLQIAAMHKAAYWELIDQARTSEFRIRKLSSSEECVDSILEKAMAATSPIAATSFLDELKPGNSMYAALQGGSSLILRTLFQLGEGKCTPDEAREVLLEAVHARYVLEGLDDLVIKFSPSLYAPEYGQNEPGWAYHLFVERVSGQVCAELSSRYDE